jgi:hypothetical protein
MWKHSRREFAGLLLGLLRPGHLKGQPTTENAPARITSRSYRADAVILLLGMTVFRRPGVGGGHASLEETGEGATLRRTLFFAGGSDPSRAHGLNRLGWIRETVLGAATSTPESGYFGVLTTSPEESLEHARQAVAAPTSGSSTFSAVSGRNTAGKSRSAVTHFEYAANALWSDRGLIDHAQSTFHDKVDWRETAWPGAPNQTPPTFLMQLATLLKQRTRHAAGRYVYNEQEYLLELDTASNRDRDRLLPVRGKIRNLHTGKESLFRVWLDDGPDSVVPVRIEYQARSFLRLTFEAVPLSG